MGTHALCVSKEDLIRKLAVMNNRAKLSGGPENNEMTLAIEMINVTSDDELYRYTLHEKSVEDLEGSTAIVYIGKSLIELDMKFELMPRKEEADYCGCEVDTELFQIIPYTIIMTTDNEGTKYVLSYKRGVKGDESRLHEKWSIGFGGHMEDEPEEQSGYSFVRELNKTATREIVEETDLYIPETDLQDYFANNSYLIIEDSEVGRVHLGICTIVEMPHEVLNRFSMDGSENISVEEGVVDNLTWCRVHDGLIFEHNWEAWSKAVLRDDLV